MSLLVLGIGSLVLGHVTYHAYYSQTSTDGNDPEPESGVQSTNTSNLPPGRERNYPLHLGVRKLRALRGDYAWAPANSEFFSP